MFRGAEICWLFYVFFCLLFTKYNMSHNVSMLYMYKGNHRFLFKNKLKINEKNIIKMRGEILEEHFYIYISLNLGSKVRIWKKIN